MGDEALLCYLSRRAYRVSVYMEEMYALGESILLLVLEQITFIDSCDTWILLFIFQGLYASESSETRAILLENGRTLI